MVLLVAAALVPTGAQATYRGHQLCDPAIGDFDAALDADQALAAEKTQVDESWRQLAGRGDPDMRAATRARRLDWLCTVKQSCGSDIAAGRSCIAEAFRRQDSINRSLLAAATGGTSCLPGSDACPQELHFTPGAGSVMVEGTLSAAHPTHVLRFSARGGQTIQVTETGAMIRGQLLLSGPLPPGAEDLYLDAPYQLPATGSYSFTLTANTMAEGAYGPFRATVTIK